MAKPGTAEGVRWRRRKDARPREILAAALTAFTERGFAATRIEDIAARAGVTKGTVYLYFPSKEELFKMLVREAVLPQIAQFEAMAAAPAASASALLRLILEAWAERVGASPLSAMPKLILSEAGNFPDLARFYLEEVVHRFLGLLRQLLRRGIEAGEFRPLDIDAAVYVVVAPLLLPLLLKHSLGPYDDRPPDLAAIGAVHADLLLAGLRR